MAEPLKSANELVAEIRGEDTEDPKDDPKAQLEYTFSFDHVESGTRKPRRGRFVNRILSNGDKRMVGVMQAQLSGGVPWESLTPFDRDLIGKLAHLSISLAKRPKWADNLEALYDVSIIDRLYEEVASHEATFHKPEQDQGVGSTDSGEAGPDGGAVDLAQAEASTA